MSELKENSYLNEEDYLKNELVSETKHEYVDGRIYAMEGASKNHDAITGNVFAAFHQHLKNSPCRPYGSDVKVKTATGSFRYPDCMVICDEQSEHSYFTESPVILVEVLSRSTRKIDEQIKRLEYINIPTLKEYVIIEQDLVDISVFRKSDDWRPTHYFLGDNIHVESIKLTLSVEDIYYRVINQDMQGI